MNNGMMQAQLVISKTTQPVHQKPSSYMFHYKQFLLQGIVSQVGAIQIRIASPFLEAWCYFC